MLYHNPAIIYRILSAKGRFLFHHSPSAIFERQSDTVGDCPPNISIFLWQLLFRQRTPYWCVTSGGYNAAI
jgi:hypothetical protein